MVSKRENARQLAQAYLAQNDPKGWFEALYAAADGNTAIIPWADMAPNPNLIQWLDHHHISGSGKRAAIIGCGLGDDAEEVARRGFDVTAFDISKTAVAWCRSRFPDSRVTYVAQDLFDAPPEWKQQFDFVLEAYTLQVLPPELRPGAMQQIADLIAPQGTLLVLCRGRDPRDHKGHMPWPLTKTEIDGFQHCGFIEIAFEDYLDAEAQPKRRFRATYHRASPHFS